MSAPDDEAGCSCGWHGRAEDVDAHTDVCPLPDELDPWFGEQAEHEARARQLFDEALGEQLMRGFLAAGRSDTVRQLVRDLFGSGFTMHDCRGAFGRKHEGGICLVPLTTAEGIAVSWAQHDVSYADSGQHQDVQDLCNDWLRDLMTVLGWRTEDFGTAGAFRVTGKATMPATGEHRPLGGGLCVCGQPVHTS